MTGSGTGVDASVDTAGDASGGAGGSATDAATDTTAWPGASCSAPGTYACAGAAQQVVLACKNGAWEHALDCAGTKLCDSTLAPTVSDRCAEQVALCAGQQPGAYVCDGAKLTHCGPDLVSATSEDCGSESLCALHVGAACAVCTDGEHRCTGAELEVCNGTQTGFDDVKACASAALCDAPSGVCDVCVAGATGCADGTHTQTCKSDGSAWSTSACPADQPKCVGAGQCVGCTSTADCPAPSGPCEVATCSSGVCGTLVTSGAACDDGDACTKGDTCNASGVCAGAPYSCDAAPDECHTSPGTCQGDGTCQYLTKANGTECAAADDCHSYACSGGVCTQGAMLPNGTDCGECKACTNGACKFLCNLVKFECVCDTRVLIGQQCP